MTRPNLSDPDHDVVDPKLRAIVFGLMTLFGTVVLGMFGLWIARII
jgi:hypothetical protein